MDSAMGLQVKMGEVIPCLKSKRSLAPIAVWGWVAGLLALGMGTRNIAAVLAAGLAIPNTDTRIVTMVVMWSLWSVVLAAIGARVFSKQGGKIPRGAAA